jgi:hypothetical protein
MALWRLWRLAAESRRRQLFGVSAALFGGESQLLANIWHLGYQKWCMAVSAAAASQPQSAAWRIGAVWRENVGGA